jgi:Sap, sulfolipid-1-addressing protein
MWGTVLLLGLAMMRDPIRVGIAVFFMSRRRGVLNLLAYWLGGMTAGISFAMAVLILLRDTALVVIQNVESTIENVRSTVPIFAGGRLLITLGVFQLLFLVALLARERARVGIPGGDVSALALQPRTPTAFSRLSARAQDMLQGDFVWPAFLFGITSAVPPIEGPIVLTVIMASGTAIGVQLSAFVVFTAMVFAAIEIPLVAYLAMPEKTQAVMLQLHDWIQAHRQRIFKTILAVMGVVFVVKGMGSL